MGRPSKHGRLDFDLRKRSRCEPILAKEKGLWQKSVESRLSTALFVSEDFKLEKTITR